MTGIIALDADGVLLDYGAAYGRAWARHTGIEPMERDPQAYWPMERWGVPRLSGPELQALRTQFDERFWGAMPAMPGALQACQLLARHGYELVCVTALEERFVAMRRRNLEGLGFPIERVIATGHGTDQGSPKAAALRSLRPVAFVDDYGPYFAGVEAGIHKALVMRGPHGSPNTADVLRLVDSNHPDLLGFARWWVASP